MVRYEHIKADYKQILREPMMVLLYLTPLFMIGVFKLIISYLPPYIKTYLNIEIMDYSSYIVAIAFITIPAIFGTVTGFMMLDDKDGKIYELMQVTPLGRDGYLFNRLFLPVIMTVIYTIITWLVIDINNIHYGLVLFLSILLCAQTAIIGIILFHIADDKVKGLTYAKGLNIVMLFAFADLLKVDSVIYFAKLFPSYWITKAIKEPSATILILSLCIHLLWLTIIIGLFKKRKN